ncbi:ribonucleotide reductase subunit alpha [Phenylobacterium soli]|uniref:Ribonucleotide reductase subunit alpha n=1 Tax=Phenylobacterium soli TaxID=2170551 RepID=A0A328AJS7_9CAUL|nr:ribonucleotide reductase subunit alpha [Phenylobacterium soli]RAK54757.1 ribonucleotide reductase subunit alpha [Phenylobacterium soli]
MSSESHFQQLIRAAATQAEPHQLLFVFAAAELPGEASAAQARRYAEGRGGALSPLMCVDKAPADLDGFETLAEESSRAGPPWQVVFAAALSGEGGRPPAHDRIQAALQSMVEAVRAGGVGRFAAYDAEGEPLLFR